MDDETQIGYIIDVKENTLLTLMNAGDQGAFPIIDVYGQKMPIGQLGAYVIVCQLDTRIVAMVTRSYIKETDVQPVGLMVLIPLGQLDEQGGFQRGVIDFPIPGASVHYMRDHELDLIFKAYEHKGYTPGYLPNRSKKPIAFDPSKLFGRHLAILGQSGSGKSWGVTNILQKAIKTMPNAHIIILDLHGEYAWHDEETGKLKSAFKHSEMNYFDARDLEIPYWLLTYAELLDLLIDPNDDKAPIQKAFLREVLLALRKKSNRKLEGVQISIDSPVYFSMVELYHQFKKANEATADFGKTKGPLTGQFDDFLVKLQSRFNDVRYDFMFKPEKRQKSDSLAGLLRDFTGLGEKKAQVTIIDFSSVPFDVRPMVSAQMGRLAFEFNYWNPRRSEFPILLVCEEAHNYIPRESGTQFDGARKSMERIAKEGRKYGVALMIVSQRPHEVSETVLAQCGNFICFRVTNPDDQQYIRALVPDAEGDLINILSALGRGEVLALGEAIPIPTRLRMYPPYPEPNSNDVDYYTQWRHGVKDIDVEDIVNRWRKQGR